MRTTETAAAVLESIANDLDAAAAWGVDVRLPPALAQAVARLARYTDATIFTWEPLSSTAASVPAGPPTDAWSATTTGVLEGASLPAPSSPAPDRPTGPTEGVTGGPVGTDLIIRLMRETTGKVWSIGDLMSAMRAEGWDTTSPSPRGVVANTLGKARHRQPEIQPGPKRGTYRWASHHQLSSTTEASDDDQSAEPNKIPSQEETEAAVETASQRTGTNINPPF